MGVGTHIDDVGGANVIKNVGDLKGHRQSVKTTLLKVSYVGRKSNYENVGGK